MNKISKKIVSLVTMAAFALTLVPAAAFAAPDDITAYTVSDAQPATYNDTTVNITLSDKDLDSVKEPGANVLVWAEDDDGNLAGSYDSSATGATKAADFDGMAVLNPSQNDISFNIYNFAAAGNYKIYVALNYNDKVNGFVNDVEEARERAIVAGGVTFYSYAAADANRSEYGVIENGTVKAEVDATVDKEITTNFVVRDGAGNATIDTLATDGATNYIVWAEKDGKPTNYVKFNGVTPPAAKNGISLKDLTPAVKVISSDKDACEIKVAFTQPGDYKLYVGVGNTVPDAQYKPLVGTTTVHVANKNVEVDSLQVSANTTNREDANKAPVAISFDSNDMGKLDLTQIDPDFDYDGIDDIILTGKVLDENGYGIQGKEVTLTTNKDAVA